MSQTTSGPQSIGIVLDGNRRWARERGYPTLVGHKAGYERVKELLGWSQEAGIKWITIYAFSAENWQRATDEVNYMMDILRQALINDFISEFKPKGYKLRIIGDRTRFPHDIQELLSKAEKETAEGENLTVVLALSYGGQDEILAAINKLLGDMGREKGAITKERFEKYMWSHGVPHPDLIIRAGGEQRLSNFLTWQSVYSELFFVKKLWPDMSREDFFDVLREFGERNRRFGK